MIFGQTYIIFISRRKLVACIALFALNGGVESNAKYNKVGTVRSGECLSISVTRLRQSGNLVFIKVTTLGINDPAIKAFSDTVKECNILIRSTVIVALQRNSAVAVWADDRNCMQSAFIKRKYAVIFQQYHGFFRTFQRNRLVLLARYNGIRYIIVFCFIIEHTKPYPCSHKVYAGVSDMLLGDKSLVKCGKEIRISAAAVYIASRFYGKSRRFNRIRCKTVMLMEIAYCPAIGHKVSVKAPLVQLGHKKTARAGSLAVYTVICAHYALNVSFSDECFKCRKIGFFNILFGNFGIKLVTHCFGTAVYSIMLSTSGSFHCFSFTLQAIYKGFSVFGGQIRIFAVSLMSSAPSRITENIDIGRPEGQPFVYISVIVFCICIILCTSFLGGYIRNLLSQFCIKHSRQTDSLRKHCGYARTRQTVKSLVPPVVCRNAQPFYGRSIVSELRSLLLHRHCIG